MLPQSASKILILTVKNIDLSILNVQPHRFKVNNSEMENIFVPRTTKRI